MNTEKESSMSTDDVALTKALNCRLSQSTSRLDCVDRVSVKGAEEEPRDAGGTGALGVTQLKHIAH